MPGRTWRGLQWSAALLLGVATGMAIAYLVATRTGTGRAWLASRLLARANAVFGGRGMIRVGVLREIGPGQVVADGVTLLDSAGVPVMTAAQVRGALSVRDLFARAIHLRSLELDGVTLTLRQDTVGRAWNLAYILVGDPSIAADTVPGFGDDVRIDALRLRNVTVTTRMPWAPHPIFTGAARDSVIAVRDSLHDLEREANGLLFEHRRVILQHAVAHEVVVVDVQRRPASLVLDSLVGTISDPPVSIRQAQGRIAWTGDSLQLDLTEVTLPGSRGRARGVIAWNQPGPVRYDVHVDADAALSDLGWIWDVLPREGRGRATVRMRTLADAYDTEYTLRDLHAESGRSVIEGQVSVIARPAELRLEGVDLQFAPLEVTLARRLSYGSIPPAVTGTISGRLRAQAGGPLTAFAIDQLDATHRSDTAAREEPSRIRLTGMVGLGAAPRVWNLSVGGFRLGLPLLRQLASDTTRAPWPDGVLDGRITVRSADLSHVEATGIDIGWTDAAGHRSRMRGDLATRFGRVPATIRGTVTFAPLSFAALARVDSVVPAHRDLDATLTVDGTVRALTWRLAAQPSGVGAGAGHLLVAGTAALLDSLWQVQATGSLDRLDLREWIGNTSIPVTALTGTVQIVADGDRPRAARHDTSASPVRVRGQFDVHQGAASDRPAFRVQGDAALQTDRLVIDSLVLRVAGAAMTASGALARTGNGSDTVQVSVRVDSLNALRADFARTARMIAAQDSTLAQALDALAADTLHGDASLAGYLHGSLEDVRSTLAFGARNVHVGPRRVDRLLGSLETRWDSTVVFTGAVTADDVRGVGAVTLQSASLRLGVSTPDSGQLHLTIRTDDGAALSAYGGYQRAVDRRALAVDSLALTYNGTAWRAIQPWRVAQDSSGWRVTPFEMRSNAAGVVRGEGVVPDRGPARAILELERVPYGEFAALLAGMSPYPGVISGRAELSGTRVEPEWRWSLTADSLGTSAVRLPRVSANGSYRRRRALAQAEVRDSLGGRMQMDVELPIDLSFDAVGPRLLDDALRGQIRADSLRLEAMPLHIAGASRLRGEMTGRFDLAGTVDAPQTTGTLTVRGAGGRIDALGIEPSDGRLLLRADADSVSILTMSVRSGGPGDTVAVQGVVHLPRGASTQRTPATIDLVMTARDFVASRQRDGTDLDISGAVRIAGPLERPTIRGAVQIPAANIVVDPLGARNALDLSTEAARALLGADEVPVAATAVETFAELGRYVTVETMRVDLGNAVWVQTPESKVKLGGGLAIEMQGDRLALDGEILATRGQYRLDLGIVNRSFAIDSGRVRFFGQAAIAPTLDITATNVVRIAGGSEIPVRVHIGGNYDRPVLSLSSSDPLYASAPESEIISLLLFGAPTFALDGQSQSTVRAVTGVLLPSVGGAVEGALQRLLPVFNTVQVTTAGGQTAGQLSALSLLDNLSISAGKQLGDRTFLRLNTGVCRTASAAATRGASLWYGAAAEYRFSALWSAQVGVDPGAAPCTRLGPDVLPRMQFGFDLFREWIW